MKNLSLKQIAQKINPIAHSPRTPKTEAQVAKIIKDSGYTVAEVEAAVLKLPGNRPPITVSHGRNGKEILILRF